MIAVGAGACGGGDVDPGISGEVVVEESGGCGEHHTGAIVIGNPFKEGDCGGLGCASDADLGVISFSLYDDAVADDEVQRAGKVLVLQSIGRQVWGNSIEGDRESYGDVDGISNGLVLASRILTLLALLILWHC